MIRPIRLAIAAASLVLAGGFTAVQAAQTCEATVPSRYVQMNSPGDGISSGAARTGNSRSRRSRAMRRPRHHR